MWHWWKLQKTFNLINGYAKKCLADRQLSKAREKKATPHDSLQSLSPFRFSSPDGAHVATELWIARQESRRALHAPAG